jgi:hypothetical protein
MVNSNIWGSHAWKFMHYVTLGYPEKPTAEQKNNYKNFFILLKHVLPCSKCAKHYEENLTKHPLTDDILNNKNKFIKWCIDLHNIVNKMLNKKILSYDEAYNILINNTNNTNSNKSYYDINVPNYEYINKSENIKTDNLSNYADYNKNYDNNVEKYYQNINDKTNIENTVIIENTETHKIPKIELNKNNNFNPFNPFTLLLILLVLIIIGLIIKKN